MVAFGILISGPTEPIKEREWKGGKKGETEEEISRKRSE